MNFLKIIKNTWSSGLLLFGFLAVTSKETKTTEVIRENKIKEANDKE